MTSVELIESIIVDLNSISVSGIDNMVKIVNSVNKLGALRKDMIGDDAHAD